MQRDEIGFRQQAIERHIFGAETLLVRLRHRPWPAIENAHGKTPGARGHRLADAAAATDQAVMTRPCMAPTWTVPKRSRRYAGIVANPPPYIEMMTQVRATNRATLFIFWLSGMRL